MQSVAVGVWAGVGSRYESPQESGISHVVEHMNFKGTHRRNARQISEAIEGVGGAMNGFTCEEATCYYAKVHHTKLARAIDVLLDIYKDSLFSPQELTRECNVIKEEIRMYNDIPHHVVQENITAIMWKNHPLGQSILGTFSSLDNVSQDRLRAFHSRYYTPRNTVISVAGNVCHDDVIACIEKHTDRWKAPRQSVSFSPYKEAQRTARFSMVTRPTEQAQFVLGFKGLHRTDPARFAFRLLSVILGENMSSRLHQDIREKRGLAYSVNTHTMRLIDTGALMVSCGTEPTQLNTALQRVVYNIRRVTQSGVTKKELAHAKEYVRGHLALSLERTASYMLWLGEYLLTTNAVMPMKDVLNAYTAVTQDDITRIASRIFMPQKASLAVVAPSIDESFLRTTVDTV